MTDNSHKATKGKSAKPATPPKFSDRQQQQIRKMYESEERTVMRMEILQGLTLREGERVLEIGSGPGLLAKAIGLAVGPGGSVVGIDINPGFVESSRLLCTDLPWVEFIEEDIENRFPLPDKSFDAVTAASVLQYVPEPNLESVLAEFHRILRPQGRVLIHDTEWDTFVHYSPNRERMKRVLTAWRSVYANPHLFQTLAPKLRNTGFAIQRREAMPTFLPELHQNTLSYVGLDFLVDMVTGRNGVTRQEAEAWAEEQKQLGQEGAYFSCAIRFLYVAMKIDGTT